MIGDDVESDIRGAQVVGMQGWLVKTGQFRKENLGRGIWPDRVLEQFADIINDA
jgi:ribonucleotide monophosphatase NagD (HAD superfamily)